ncbi:MAG: nucleotidyltransferase family protein [Phenylobacterium sp.]
MLDLKRSLLAMLGGAAPPRLDTAEWDSIDAMAQQHRLQPLLAARLDAVGGAWPVPPGVATGWRGARHSAGMASLAQQAALRLAAGRLRAAGVRFCALKGPRLAWRCYPEASLRPMRDLDLLVDEADVSVAARALADGGFVMQGDAASLAEALAFDKHLPFLWHAGLSVALELHHRLSDPPGRHGYHVPQLDSSATLARSEAVALAGFEAPCQSADDLLEHLMVHALYGHRLDCGPLILADIHYLLAAEPIDAARFSARAQAGGWGKGAVLLIGLTERYFGPQPLRLPGMTPPEEMVAAAEEALLQDLDNRGHAEALADVLAARSPSALAGALTRRLRPARHVVHDEGEGGPAWRFWPGWAWRRLGRLFTRLGDRRAGREAHRAATLLRWLQS